MRYLLLLLLCVICPAQVVYLSNHSDVPYEGWVRTNVDVVPPYKNGIVTTIDGNVYPYILGRVTGSDTHVLDIRAHLEPGEKVTLNLKGSKESEITRAPLPTDPISWFGGLCTINGVLLNLIELNSDGAGYLSHMRCRVGRMIVVDLWTHWCPDQPWARAEVMVTASNPVVQDMVESIPPNFELKFGDAIIVVPGRRVNAPLIDSDRWLADGQGIQLPIVFLWPRHVTKPSDWASIGSCERLGSVGIARLLPNGNPLYPSMFDPITWAGQRLAESIRRLHTWEQAIVGPNKRSGDTGAQEDQTFKSGESLLKGGSGAERIDYLGAMKMAARPCHHLEVDGSQLSPNHKDPRLVFWDMRPHIPGVSPDRLGKPRGLGIEESNGCWGADVEHWLINRLAGATRLTGSPALQYLMSAQARNYPYQWTTRPDLPYQSVPFASRAVGWEGINAVHLWLNLEDRDLATVTKAHWLDRATKVLVPVLGSMPGDVWDWRRDDRLGPGIRYMPWQQAVGAYGMDLAGEVLGHEPARKVAWKAAQAVIRDAYVKQGDRWATRDVVAQDGAEVTTGAFDFFGMPMAVATVLRHDPKNEPCVSIWRQLLRECVEPVHTGWLAPGIPGTIPSSSRGGR